MLVFNLKFCRLSKIIIFSIIIVISKIGNILFRALRVLLLFFFFVTKNNYYYIPSHPDTINLEHGHKFFFWFWHSCFFFLPQQFLELMLEPNIFFAFSFLRLNSLKSSMKVSWVWKILGLNLSLVYVSKLVTLQILMIYFLDI